jgi:MFS transporter, MFS domain-containing protein family, molybdate-anion transporter
VLLVIGGLIVLKTWTENYGDARANFVASIKESFRIVLKDKKVSMTGFMQSFFESGMFTFVFMWTPALMNTTPFNVLFGWVFSAFMVI